MFFSVIMVKIGVLSVQGDVREHTRSLEQAGAEVTAVLHASDLAGLDGLVLPGGESTAMGVLLSAEPGFLDALRAFSAARPVWGTCAGLVMLADTLTSTSAKQGGQSLIGGLKVGACLVHT
jgi:5'-phosphate synthase pdxT subunit